MDNEKSYLLEPDETLLADLEDAMSSAAGCSIIQSFLAGANLGTRVRIKFEDKQRYGVLRATVRGRTCP